MEDYPRTLLELERRFSTDSACRQYLFDLRWPEGFVCPRCGGRTAWPMVRRLWLCKGCRYQLSVTAGTIFQDSRLPLALWFRAIWQVCAQKNGVSALGVQRVLGFGSYQTAWAWLHKLRRAMIRPDRDRLGGRVEVDETYIGGESESKRGRGSLRKALVVIAAQEDGEGTGRVRMARIADASQRSLLRFIEESVQPGATIRTDGWRGYSNLRLCGYQHESFEMHGLSRDTPCVLLPRVHLVASLLKRWLAGTHQGAVSKNHLDFYLDEFTFRFNRRKSKSRGKLFYRLLQQAVNTPPQPYAKLVRPQHIVRG